MAVPVLLIDAVDVIDAEQVQHKSLQVTLNTLDVTLIDLVPALGDAVDLDSPAWVGAVVATDMRVFPSQAGDVTYTRVTAKNSDALADGGVAPFNLDLDAPNNTTTFDAKDLVIQRTVKDATNEVRATCTVLRAGLWTGMEIDVTSASHGLTAETFTIMAITVTWLAKETPQFALDLGLGDWATASTGSADGGPLDPVTIPDVIVDTIEGSIDNGDIGDAIDTAVGAGGAVGYSSIGEGVDPPDLDAIEIDDDRIALIWWGQDVAHDGNVVITEISGDIVSHVLDGFAWVTASEPSTFTALSDDTEDTFAIHVIVCKLGQAEYATVG